MQTVTNAIPVVKTRTVQRTLPSYSTQSVTKDYGHWETVVEEVAGSCYGVGQAMATGLARSYAVPAMTTTTRRVWVPSVVTEEVPVVTNTVQNEEVAYTVYEQQSTQVPYECAYVVHRPEQRTGTKKVVEYVPYTFNPCCGSGYSTGDLLKPTGKPVGFFFAKHMCTSIYR